jgi:hypothetical protein
MPAVPDVRFRGRICCKTRSIGGRPTEIGNNRNLQELPRDIGGAGYASIWETCIPSTDRRTSVVKRSPSPAPNGASVPNNIRSAPGRFKNCVLVFSQHGGLVDRPMVMELPPRATHLHEPSGCANPKLEPNSGSFANAFFTSHKEVIVIVTLRREIVERHADSRWPAKQLRIALPDGRPSAPDTADRIIHARSFPVRPVGTERF